MESVSSKLKELRESARPRLSIRAMAEMLGVPSASYNFYERVAYKKPFLPIDLTRKVAAILAERGVDSKEVLKLAGLSDDEAEPEAREIEAAQPDAQYVTLPLAVSVPVSVALPSEAALAAMFESLLATIPEDASRAEAARILARRLPTGFAAIGPAAGPQGSAEAPAPAAPLPDPTRLHRAPSRR